MAFLKYLEEALAEGYAQFRAHGLQAGLQAYEFPIDRGYGGYVTVTQLKAEGAMVGTIMLGGATFYVYIVIGPFRRAANG